MSKHTPGPWRYSEVIGGCFVYAGSRQVLRYASSPDAENKANARLIAAAPDLLDRLELVSTWLKSALDCKQFCWDADQHEAASESLEAARAAIAKATQP